MFLLNGMLNPITYLGYTGCRIQQVTAPTLAMTWWIQQPTCVVHSSCKGGFAPPVQENSETHLGCWIQQVFVRVGAVTLLDPTTCITQVSCLIQQPV